MDSEDEYAYGDVSTAFDVSSTKQIVSRVARKQLSRRWDLRKMTAAELRTLNVNPSIENSCNRFEDLQEDLQRTIFHRYIDLHEDSNSSYFTLSRAKQLANVNKTLWGFTHDLPSISVNIGSINCIDICMESDKVDRDGDRLAVSRGLWRAFLQIRSKQCKSVLKMANGQFAPVLDVDIEMKYRSFINHQPEEDRIEEQSHTFFMETDIFMYSCGQGGRTKVKAGRYKKTRVGTFKPLQPIEIDEDGDGVIDDEVTRLPLIIREERLKAFENKTRPFVLDLKLEEKMMKCSTYKALNDRMVDNLVNSQPTAIVEECPLEFTFKIEALLCIMQHAICPLKVRERVACVERAARKRAVALMEEVRTTEKESSISALMRDHDEESHERTEEKRRKCLASSGAGSSSGVTTIDVQLRNMWEIVTSRERDLKIEYERLASRVGIPGGRMAHEALNEVKGRLDEIRSILLLMLRG